MYLIKDHRRIVGIGEFGILEPQDLLEVQLVWQLLLFKDGCGVQQVIGGLQQGAMVRMGSVNVHAILIEVGLFHLLAHLPCDIGNNLSWIMRIVISTALGTHRDGVDLDALGAVSGHEELLNLGVLAFNEGIDLIGTGQHFTATVLHGLLEVTQGNDGLVCA